MSMATTVVSGTCCGIAKAKPGFAGERDGARFQAVRRIAMKIRPAGNQQLQIVRKHAVVLGRSPVVIRMVGLERIETSADVRRNPFVHGGLSRVGERSDAMGAVEGRDHLFGRRPGASDERGTA